MGGFRDEGGLGFGVQGFSGKGFRDPTLGLKVGFGVGGLRLQGFLPLGPC